MANYVLYKGLDEEKRRLSVVNAQLKRHLATLRQRREEAEEKAKEWRKKYEEQQQENQKLRDELEKIKKQRDTYRDMLFKANKKLEDTAEQGAVFHSPRKRGGQVGHSGYGRKSPVRIDKQYSIYAACCPTCLGKLNRSKTTVSHIVEDIPALQQQETIITRYEVEKQWCRKCKKEVVVTPEGVIPESRLGLNLIIQVLVWKYLCRIPFNIIVTLLEITYDVHVSAGTLVLFLKKTSQYFGKPYNQILKEVRAAPVKHADETGWRVNGENHWCWAFLTSDAVYYTIEETRGKGSSEEMKQLHQQIKQIYQQSSQGISKPFVKGERQKTHDELLGQLHAIITKGYISEDAQRIQYRIASQNKNLLTALLYENAPLTNNLAERAIRPMVVTRKISGGSRSRNGAHIHAINMSVIQTMTMKKQPIIPTLQQHILSALSSN